MEFDFAYYHFVEAQSSAREIEKALDHWEAIAMEFGQHAPWQNASQLYDSIDSIQHGDYPWKSYSIRYQGPLPPGVTPKWMTETYVLCTRDSRQVLQHQLATKEFRGKINYAPYRQFDGKRQRVWSNLMSADWAWSQAVSTAFTCCSIKLTVTDILICRTRLHRMNPIMGQCSSLLLQAATRPLFRWQRVTRSTTRFICLPETSQTLLDVHMELLYFLSHSFRSPKVRTFVSCFSILTKICAASRKYRKSVRFQEFTRQMYHACLALIFEPLKNGMTTPEVVKCPDGHFRRAIYGLGPYIADYPEQVWLTCIVQGWCPK